MFTFERIVRIVNGVVVLAVVLAGASCDRPGSPSGVFTGAWTGVVVENPRGNGTIRLVLDHQGAMLSGTLRTTFQGVVDRDGPVTGVAAGGSATMTFVPAQPFDCGAAGTLTGTVTLTIALANDRLAGSYSQFTCAGAVTAIVDLARQ